MNSRLKFLCALLLSHISINNCLNDSELVKFTLLHNNDLHARFEQISATLSTCSEYLEEANDCYGGFARTAHKDYFKA
uniref:Uncharacterized protein n=1 Tax=Megaselia scalaris TaxID=36166 RepID=T1H0M6_MEGSC